MGTSLTDHTNLFDYFRERVDRAQCVVSIDLHDDTGLYLASLLTERTRAEHRHAPQETLAELHGAALEAPPSGQVRVYRELGDRALYVLGCFAESLERGLVGPRYYAQMGSAAYDRVDRVLKTAFADPFGPVFQELSELFDGCVALLREVRASHHDGAEPEDLLRIYERWLCTKDPSDARRLGAMGLDVGSALDA